MVTQLLAKRVDVFDPGLVFSLFMFLGYVVPYSRMGSPDDTFALVWPYEFSNVGQSREAAIQITLVASIAFLLAYYPALRLTTARAVKTTDRWRERRSGQVSAFYVLFGLGVVAAGVYRIGGISVILANLGDRTRLFAGLNYYFAATNLVLVAALVSWIRFLTGAKRRPPVLLMVLSLILASILGNRATVIVFIIACAVSWHWLRRTISARTMGVGALGALVCLVILQLGLREYLAVGQLVTVDIADPWSFIQAAIREFRGNFVQLQVLTVIVDASPGLLPVQYGTTLLATAQIAIPSALLADKPLTAAGVLTTNIWPLRWSELGTTMPPGLVGEFYMNFQTIGVVVGMMTVGAMYGASKGSATSGKLSRIGTHAILVGLLGHYLRGETAGPTVLLGLLLIPFLIAMRLSTEGPHPREKGFARYRQGEVPHLAPAPRFRTSHSGQRPRVLD